VKALEPSKGEAIMGSFLKLSASLILAAGSLAQAQDLSFAARVTVPFPFETSSGQHFRPGEYTIRTTGLRTMLIRSGSSSGLALIQEEVGGGATVSRGKAIFSHYGDKYFLRSVALPGTSTRLSFGKSIEERESQAAASRHASTVELALLASAQ
jgi:hypothetical protein